MERILTRSRLKRPYDSARRREQAAHTRDLILQVARLRFLADGFKPTTIAAIAAGAGVSVDVIYKGFGGKPGLARAICEQALAGEGPIPAEIRSDELQSTDHDPRTIIRGWGTLTTEVSPRVAPILLLIRDVAASDPEMANLQAEMDGRRLDRMTHNARNLASEGYLRDDVSVGDAADIMWAYSSPQLYELLVLVRGWPIPRYGTFIADAMISALLPAADDPGASSR